MTVQQTETRDKIVQVLGKQGDECILDYMVSTLSDAGFDYDEGWASINQALGIFMVEGGFLSNDGEAEDASKKLFKLIKGTSAPISPSLAPQTENSNGTSGTMVLKGGPVTMEDISYGNNLYDKSSTRHMIQSSFEGEDSTSVANKKDRAKLERRRAREEAAQLALMKEQQEAADKMAEQKVVIVRDQGGLGSRDIHLMDISVSNGGAELIGDCSITLANGRRYGLVGRNGAGKSTFLRALSRHQIKGLPENCQVLHVEQEIRGGDLTVMETVLQCDEERIQLLQEEKDLTTIINSDATQDKIGKASERLSQVHTRLTEIDADSAESKAAKILAGLSFTEDMQHRQTRTFSGGWRMRVALARALYVQPDLLLLDEPTNHLDMHAVMWLEDYLMSWSGTVVVVSHARHFLNIVCTDILHLVSNSLVLYRGDFDTFERQKSEKEKNQARRVEQQEKARAHMQAFIDKFRYNAKRASLVQSRIKAVGRLGEIETMEDNPDYVFTFPPLSITLSPPIISFTDVEFGYPGRDTLLSNLSFGIDLDSRLGIVGANGAGKSTLLGLINGTLEATGGTVQVNPKLRIASFSQHHMDGLAMHLTPLQYFAQLFPEAGMPQHRSHLAQFGVSTQLAEQPMYTLSGGQKSRVVFAKVTWSKPHMLLLDEPSNHLDMEAIDALILGLTTYNGGVIMVSHDQYLIESTMDELWVCKDGTVSAFDGDFKAYKAMLKKEMA